MQKRYKGTASPRDLAGNTEGESEEKVEADTVAIEEMETVTITAAAATAAPVAVVVMHCVIGLHSALDKSTHCDIVGGTLWLSTSSCM